MIIDQLVNIEPITQERIATKLELLGKESVQHAHWIMQLIEGLGGEPQLPFEVLDRMTDIPSLLLKQLDKEKLAQSLFQQAKACGGTKPSQRCFGEDEDNGSPIAG